MSDTMMDDATQITNLLYRYGELFDQGRFDDVIELFGKLSLSWRMAEKWHLRACARFGISWSSCMTGCRAHAICAPIRRLPLRGMRPHAALSMSCFKPPQTASQPIVSGTYHDRFFKTPEGVWKFKSRQYKTMDLVGDTSEHMRTDVLENLNTD